MRQMPNAKTPREGLDSFRVPVGPAARSRSRCFA